MDSHAFQPVIRILDHVQNDRRWVIDRLFVLEKVSNSLEGRFNVLIGVTLFQMTLEPWHTRVAFSQNDQSQGCGWKLILEGFVVTSSTTTCGFDQGVR